ncbi:MAG: Mov34/MPN/PAD-1 family protein [Candidatus Bathyarchaeia archaeon]
MVDSILSGLWEGLGKLFKVRISSEALHKIMRHVSRPYEQIGLLIGEVNGGTVIVRDAVRGEGSAGNSHSTISPESMARVAHAILTGKINGRIVGWYHSHVGCGVFMSNVDVQTQLVLQQFSQYVISLVIDSRTGELAAFTYNQPLGVVQLPIEFI